MSDRKNRDRGNKKARGNPYSCDCWLCTDGKTKKRIKLARQEKKEHDIRESIQS